MSAHTHTLGKPRVRSLLMCPGKGARGKCVLCERYAIRNIDCCCRSLTLILGAYTLCVRCAMHAKAIQNSDPSHNNTQNVQAPHIVSACPHTDDDDDDDDCVQSRARRSHENDKNTLARHRRLFHVHFDGGYYVVSVLSFHSFHSFLIHSPSTL